jgi:hypothetical protein
MIPSEIYGPTWRWDLRYIETWDILTSSEKSDCLSIALLGLERQGLPGDGKESIALQCQEGFSK